MNSAVSAPSDEDQLSDSRSAFFRLLGLFVVLGSALGSLAYFLVDRSITTQRGNIALLQQENGKLDAQIKEIANLESDIKTLHQRQKAVETLEAVRNLPVQMLSGLVQATPKAVFLTKLAQVGTRLTISGVARSNGEVAQFLRNLDGLPTHFVHPELVETVASWDSPNSQELRNALTFSIGVDLVNADEVLQGQPPAASDKPAQ
jgi:type IV pilus assembly protein PilN